MVMLTAHDFCIAARMSSQVHGRVCELCWCRVGGALALWQFGGVKLLQFSDACMV